MKTHRVQVALAALFAAVSLRAEEPTPSSGDLAEMSVEQLLNLTVTSVARREEKLSRSPAAIHVITQEDIRRSGATTIPELLRMVPGMNVASLDGHTWAISARGFNDVYANKLLVLMDGRSVYTPLFSGVYWDSQDTVLADIDRIEVIRGPGAALWGANAVNGVINIITKRSVETQGLLATFGGGTEERAFGSIRFGGKISDHIHYRVYGKFFDRDDTAALDGGDANDEWRMGRAGFRIDWSAPGDSLFTLQGDIYNGRVDQTYRRVQSRSPFAVFTEQARDRVSGGNVLARFTHEFTADSDIQIQAYYDRINGYGAVNDEERDTFDLDFQHRFAFGERQTIVWGGGYRHTADTIRSTFDVEFDPGRRASELYSAFVQDEVTLFDKMLSVTLGSKFEHNDFTGFEIQPSGRLLWTPDPRHTVWASISRAVRTPSRAEDDIALRGEPVLPEGALFPGFAPLGIPPSPAIVTTLRGDRDFGSEKLIAYEFGYRVQPHDRVSLDLALFYNDYDELRSIEPGDPAIDFTKNPAELLFSAANNLQGETYGGELSAAWQAADWWRLRADYALLFTRLHLVSGADTRSERSTEGSSPRHQFALRSAIDLPRGFELDAALRYVDALPALDVPSYVALDLRLGWRVSRNVELSIVGQNLLDSRHREFAPTFVATQATEIERSVYGKVTVRF